MWYEIIPSVAVVLTCIGAPAFINYATGYLITRNGKGIPRNWNAHKLDFTAYLRDRHITGSEYIPRGLESIPDED